MNFLNVAFEHLRNQDESVPQPARLPTEEEARQLESILGCEFHPDFRRYLLEVSNVSVSVLEPVTATPESGHTYFPHVLESARQWGVPEDLIPICHENADFFCMNTEGEVLFWSHDEERVTEIWPNLAAWIEEVWIGGCDR